MANDQSSLKQRIRAGTPILGVQLPTNPSRKLISDLASRNRYDYFQVDAQHSAFCEIRLREICEMAGELSMPVVLRIKHTRQTYLIGNLLDLGPVGIEVPQVELEATSDEAVANFYYPPDGVRSWGGRSRHGFTGQPLDEYINFWQQTGVLAMQLESITAVTAVRNLSKTGVDFVTFGPSDLTLNMRSYPNHALKTVEDCVAYVANELLGTGIGVCMRVEVGSDKAQFEAMGVTMFLEIGVS